MANKRRVYGEGSISQREDGRWQVSVPGQDGKRRYGYRDTEKEAEQLRRKMLAEVGQGRVIASKQPFKVHVAEWLEMKRKGGDFKPNSYINARSCLTCHFLPALGDIPLNKLTPSHIRKIYNKLLDKKLNPNTIRGYHQMLKSCLDSAVKQGKLNENPCDRVELPRKRKPKNTFLSQEDALRVLEACQGHEFLGILVPLALATEARESELLALRWSDVDLEKGTMNISRTLTADLNEEEKFILAVVSPKSESGTRTITLPAFAVEVLRSHQTAQRKKLFTIGKQNPLNLVFLSRTGNYIRWQSLRVAYNRTMGKLGISATFHDLRHTGATLLLERGIPANAVQQRLGHSDVRTTLYVYGHATKRMEDQGTSMLDGLFGEKNTDTEAI